MEVRKSETRAGLRRGFSLTVRCKLLQVSWTSHMPIFGHVITLPPIYPRAESDEREAFHWSDDRVLPPAL